MDLGKLFISLGIKGADQTVGSLNNVKKGLKETSSLSLEAKAALLGVFYTFQRYMRSSAQVGTGLDHFNAVLGVSTKTLQQYQYAARQVGVANEDVTQSFKTLQDSMTKTLTGQGGPAMMARVAELVGEFKAEDIKRYAENPELLLQKLQEYAAKEQHAGLRNQVLQSFGLSEGMIAALTKQAFKPDILKRAPTYSDSEIKNLNKADAAWRNLGNAAEMAFGRFNAQEGYKITQDLAKLIPQIATFAKAVTEFAGAVKIFAAISMAIEGWGHIFKGGASAVDWGKEVGSQLMDYIGEAAGLGKEKLEGANSTAIPELNRRQGLTPEEQVNVYNFKKSITPTPKGQAQGSTTNNNVNVNQNLNFQHEGKNATQTGQSVQKAVNDAFRQMPSQGRGN